MSSNKLPELGTKSYALFCFLSTLLHPMQTRLFVYSLGTTLTHFLVYVDDLIITGSDPSLVDTII